MAFPSRTRTLLLLACALVYWGAMFAATHASGTPGPQWRYQDKLAHFAGYAGLAMLFCGIAAFRWRPGGGVYVAVVALAATYGAADELTQPFVGRTCDIFDWLADLLGAAAGALVFAAVWQWRMRRRAAAGSDEATSHGATG